MLWIHLQSIYKKWSLSPLRHTSPVTIAGVQKQKDPSLVAEKADPDANTRKLREKLPYQNSLKGRIALDTY